MRFVGQKDGEDQDPGNVQVTFEHRVLTFLLDRCPAVSPVRWTQVAKDPENLHRSQSALALSRQGVLVETIPFRCPDAVLIATPRRPRAPGVA